MKPLAFAAKAAIFRTVPPLRDARIPVPDGFALELGAVRRHSGSALGVR
ncbi:MAG TPA: hypothetical protein VGF86_12200 [Candidatus Tumulicola sp.]|jgi:hypothetical protein